ncbi:LON peptidase substrate-binding domain-containing protein [Hamadaea tsunoensis]|uniref:LON peptidase substrate-binding domain-containing protein n=1 Tax=Hamadaea tsunoensis TaxID=53368 RepID=UPI0004858876|nr:LON peptidase substrate-binding domain-containing protein [Hamadaea tsunoensis]
MSPRLPLFPLGTVLFPGLVLPLHIFEDRYLRLIRSLMDLPDGTPREFGVVAIDQGLEVLPAAPSGVVHNEVSLHDVGCVAQLRQVTERPDGKMDVVAVGDRRFRITGLVAGDTPYPVAQVEWFPEPDDTGEADELTPRVLSVFRDYLAALRGGQDDQLPDDPTVLSHLVAATTALTVADRQALLAAPDTAARMRLEIKILNRESALLREVRAIPMPPSELHKPPSLN